MSLIHWRFRWDQHLESLMWQSIDWPMHEIRARVIPRSILLERRSSFDRRCARSSSLPTVDRQCFGKDRQRNERLGQPFSPNSCAANHWQQTTSCRSSCFRRLCHFQWVLHSEQEINHIYNWVQALARIDHRGTERWKRPLSNIVQILRSQRASLSFLDREWTLYLPIGTELASPVLH